MSEMAGKIGNVQLAATSAEASAVLEEFNGDGIITDFQLTLAADKYVDSVTATVDGAEVTAFSVTAAGLVSFLTPPGSGTNNVDITFDRYAVSSLGSFFEWKLTWSAEAKETTDFDSGGNREYIPGLKDWKCTASRYFSDSAGYPQGRLGVRTIVVLHMDQSGGKTLVGWAILIEFPLDVEPGEVVESPIEFQGTDTLGILN